ncbi:MAG: FadR family transcriptional regulator [Ruminococcus sp.]|nr:FadR family transcriptional regulator [Ruminococcus sp.]
METREYQKTINYIFDLIEGGLLKVGDQLPTERKLSERLGISRNSIREALRTLENLGLVECRQGSGTYLVDHVSETFKKAINIMLMMKQTSHSEICEFRRHMEKAACRFVISKGVSEEARSALLSAVERLKLSEETNGMAEADTLFHYTLIRATGNSFMITIFDAVTDTYRKFIDDILTLSDSATKSELNKAHEKIARSLVSGDEEACIAAINEHYDIVERIEESHNAKH